MSEKAVCRGCRRELRGEAYYKGGPAYHPETNERCKVNFFGGFVCSSWCDKRASLNQMSDMPGAGEATNLSGGALESYNRNWSDAR